MSIAHVASISIYPIKSFGPSLVSAARIVEGGALEHDREFGLFDANGKFVNGKRNPKVHTLSAAVDWKDLSVYFKPMDSVDDPTCFNIRHETDALERWLSDYFGEPITWRRNSRGGFPDDSAAPGPTIISDATFAEVTSWYPGLNVSEVGKRFRANIEIHCDEPFWEDRLFGDPDTTVNFLIGDVLFHGIKPCKRCVVPTRQSEGGEPTPDFADIFMAQRARTLPAWSNRSRFDHFYRLAINTRVAPSEVGKLIEVGTPIEILGIG